MRLPLRWKITLYSSTILVVLMAGMIVFVNYQASRFVDGALQRSLDTGIAQVGTVETQRLSGLREAAALVASFPDLKALLDTDTPTIRDFLMAYQQENQRSELLIALSPGGAVMGRTDAAGSAPLAEAEARWVNPTLAGEPATGILETESGLYHAAVMPATAAGALFGFVIAGAPIDDSFAQSLRGESDDEIVVVSDREMRSTLPPENLPFRGVDEWKQALSGEPSGMLVVGGVTYRAGLTRLGRGGGPQVIAVLLKSRDRAMTPYRNIQFGVAILGLFAAVGGIATSLLLARSVTAPIARLVDGLKQVAVGNYDVQIGVSTNDEIGDLSRSFNHMIGERGALEQRMQQSQKMEAVGRLAGGLAHDFNNVLTVILGRTEIMLSRVSPNHPMRSDIELIQTSAERASALTQQLLAFSRKQIMIPRVMDLNTLVDGIDGMLRRLIGEDVELDTILDSNLGHIRADRSQVEQVIMNLVVNSRDAMPDGGQLTIRTFNDDVDSPSRSQALGLEAGRYVVLSVQDTGLGMTSEVRARIFEPFYTTKDPSRGTGLGLSTVYGIVQQSGGSIEVSSTPGKGTTFNVYMPRVDEPLEIDLPTVTPETLAQGSETILLVEDEHVVRDLVSEILRMHGYRVLEARDGLDAIDIAGAYTGTINLLVTDVVMPRLSGPEAARRVTELRPGIRVLFVSGYTEDSRWVLDPGIAYLQKPFTLDGLARKVREVLDSL